MAKARGRPAQPAQPAGPEYPLEQRNTIAEARGIRLVNTLRRMADFIEAMRLWWANHPNPSSEEVKHAEQMAEHYAFSKYVENGGDV